MSLKIKLASAIIMFLAVLAALVIGVLAAQSQTINMQGTINFEIADRSLYVKSASIDYGDGQERALDSFMPGYINGSFTANIGEHTITNTNFKICFDIINTTENTYYALEETTLSSELQGKITATASGTINPTTITDFDDEGNAVITPDTETNGRVTLTVSAPSLLTLDLSGITITINEAQELTGFTFRNTSDNTGELYRYNGTETDVVIPSSYSIRESDGAFITGTDYKVTSTYDGRYDSGGQDYVFIDVASNITSITFPETLEKIGDNTLRNCSKLTEIVIPARVTSIGDSAFYNCSAIESINLPDNVTSIGRYAFYNCSSLQSIEIPASATSIQMGAFKNCGQLQSIEIPSSITSIEDYAFQNCSQLTSIEIPNGVTSIGANAFQNCSQLQSIEIPSSITSIEYGVFSGCSSLVSINIPDGVTSIKGSAFQNCSQLTSIEIPNGVTSIGDNAFLNCNLLQYNEDNNGKYLGNTSNPYVVLVDTITTDFTQFTINESCQVICSDAFQNCGQLQSIEIPSRVAYIGASAFESCSSLETVTFENNSQLTTIERYAFRYCSSLQSIEIPSNVTSIGEYAFLSCRVLTTVTIDSKDIFEAATSSSACGSLLDNSRITTTTVRVLKSIVDGGAVNSYITSTFTNTSEDGNYYVYSK